MKKVFFLSSCSTCQRILKLLPLPSDIELIDIKLSAISDHDLDEIALKSGSYESLFSKKAMKYKLQGLDKIILCEADYRKKILEEYTFLRRPVICYDNFLSIGNSPLAIENSLHYFESLSSAK